MFLDSKRQPSIELSRTVTLVHAHTLKVLIDMVPRVHTVELVLIEQFVGQLIRLITVHQTIDEHRIGGTMDENRVRLTSFHPITVHIGQGPCSDTVGAITTTTSTTTTCSTITTTIRSK